MANSGTILAKLIAQKGQFTKTIKGIECALSDTPPDVNLVSKLVADYNARLITFDKLTDQLADSLGGEDQEKLNEYSDYRINAMINISPYETKLKSLRTDTNDDTSRPGKPVRNELKLPKLIIPKYNGDILEWQSFWDMFSASIHTRESLPTIQKFTYLRENLTGEAARCIQGFSLTSANYVLAIQTLTDRFGKKDRIVQAHMRALLNLDRPKYNCTELHTFYDILQSHIRSLTALGKFEENVDGSLLSTIVQQKLPNEVIKNIARDTGKSDWSLKEVLHGLEGEIHILETADIHSSDPETGGGSSNSNSSISSFLTKTQKGKTTKTASVCAYCSEAHASSFCSKLSTYDDRIAFIRKNKLCFNCLGKHNLSSCKSKYKCKNCKRMHHTSICNSTGESDQSKS